MSVPQLKFREVALQLLCTQCDRGFSEEVVPLVMESAQISKKNVFMIQEHVVKVSRELPGLDAQIAAVSEEYSLDRISMVDKNILRLLLHEVQFGKLPIAIAVKEALRLASKFSSPEAGSFVHAILDRIYKERYAPAALV